MSIPKRIPRAFSGKKAEGLRELYSAMHDAMRVLNISTVVDNAKRYNTIATVVTRERNGDKPQKVRTIFYRRQDINEVFKLAGAATTKNSFHINDNIDYDHPLDPSIIIGMLNSGYQCDFELEDLNITYTLGSHYTIEAKSDSLGFVGNLNLIVGVDRVQPLVPTEQALLDSNTSIANNAITINGRSYNLNTPDQLVNKENFIFHEFTRSDGKKVQYFLNAGTVNVTAITNVAADSTPSTANLNQTALPTNGKFILTPYAGTTTSGVTSNVGLTDQFIRFTTWLTPTAFDLVFTINLNGKPTTLANIINGNDTVDIDMANNVIILTNKTYRPLNITINAKTPSIACNEDPSFRFLNVGNSPDLVSGYECYNYTLKAQVHALENIAFKHVVPSSQVYTALLSRLNEIVGDQPIVSETNGNLTNITRLNQDNDAYDLYASEISIKDNVKTVLADIGVNGLRFLDAFAIDAVQWDILQSVDLNTPIIQMDRVNNGVSVESVFLTPNQIMARGVWDDASKQFIIGVIDQDNWNGYTKFTYNDNKVFLQSSVTLSTVRNITSTYFPTLSLIDPNTWKTYTAHKPDWATKYGADVFAGFQTTILDGVGANFSIAQNITPTKAQLDAGQVQSSVMVALRFNQAVKPILDRALTRVGDKTAPLFKLSTAGDNISTTTLSLTVADYLASGFDSGLLLDTGEYVFVAKLSIQTPLNPDFNLANASDAVDRVDNVGEIDLFFDIDSIYGSIFKDIDFTYQKKLVNSISFNSPNLTSPTAQIADGQHLLLASSQIQNIIQQMNVSIAGTTDSGSYYINRQDSGFLDVNVKRVATPLAFWFVVQLNITQDQYNAITNVTMTDNTGNYMGLNLANHIAIIDNKFYAPVYVTTPSSKLFTLNTTIDLDGSGLIYAPMVSSYQVNVNIIEPPQQVFISPDTNANNDSQTDLLSHVISGGYDPITNPTGSPFVAYSQPQSIINNLNYGSTQSAVTGSNIPVIGGSLTGVDGSTVVAVEFKLNITQADLDARADDDTIIGTISRVDGSFSMNIPMALIKRQSYQKNGVVNMYLLFNLTDSQNYNGLFMIDIDWDGLGTNDAYNIAGGTRNTFYRQQLTFQMALNVAFMPRNQAKPVLNWVSKDTHNTLYALVLSGDIQLPGVGVGNYLDPSLYSYDVVDGATRQAIVNVIYPNDTLAHNALAFAETNITDFDMKYIGKSISSIGTSNNTINIDASQLKKQIFKYGGTYYFAYPVTTIVPAGNLQFTTRFDKDTNRYVDTTSNLPLYLTTEVQTTSPSVRWAKNQTELHHAFKMNIAKIPAINPNNTMDESFVTVTADDFSLNASVIKQDQRSFMTYLQVVPTNPGDINAINSSTTYTITVNGTVASSGSGVQLNQSLFTYNGNTYLGLLFPQGMAVASVEVSIDLDGSGNQLYLPTTSKVGLAVTWIDRISINNPTIANNQSALLDAFNTGKFTNLNDGITIPDTAAVVYDQSHDSVLGVTTTWRTNIRTPVFFDLNMDDKLFNSMSSVSKAIVTKDGSQIITDWNTFKSHVVNYGGRYYYVDYTNNVSSNTSFGITLSVDATTPKYIDANGIFSVAYTYIASVPSPKFTFKQPSLQVLTDISSGKVTIPSLNGVNVCTPRLYYVNSQDSQTLNAQVNSIDASLKLPILIDVDIHPSLYSQLDANATLTITNTITGNVKTVSGDAFKSMLTQLYGDTYQFPILTDITQNTGTLQFNLDVDGNKYYYLPTLSTISWNIKWITPVNSATFTLTQDQKSLFIALRNEQIPGSTGYGAKLVKSGSYYFNLTDANHATSTVITQDLTKLVPYFLQYTPSSEAVVNNVISNSQIVITDYQGNKTTLGGDALNQQLISYNNQQYLLVYLQGGQSVDATYRIDFTYDTTNSHWLTSTSNIEVNQQYQTLTNSPSVTIAPNQNDLYVACLNKSYPLPNIGDQTYVKASKINYNILDTNRFAATVTAGSGTYFPVFYQVAITLDELNILDINTFEFNVGGVAIGLNDFKAALINYNGNFYYPIAYPVGVATTNNDFVFRVNINSKSDNWIETVSTVNVVVAFVQQIMSPALGFPSDYPQLLQDALDWKNDLLKNLTVGVTNPVAIDQPTANKLIYPPRVLTPTLSTDQVTNNTLIKQSNTSQALYLNLFELLVTKDQFDATVSKSKITIAGINLNTVTGNLKDFVVVVNGRYFIPQLLEVDGGYSNLEPNTESINSDGSIVSGLNRTITVDLDGVDTDYVAKTTILDLGVKLQLVIKTDDAPIASEGVYLNGDWGIKGLVPKTNQNDLLTNYNRNNTPQSFYVEPITDIPTEDSVMQSGEVQLSGLHQCRIDGVVILLGEFLTQADMENAVNGSTQSPVKLVSNMDVSGDNKTPTILTDVNPNSIWDIYIAGTLYVMNVPYNQLQKYLNKLGKNITLK